MAVSTPSQPEPGPLEPLLELLQCPVCQGGLLLEEEDTLRCRSCHHPYPVVEGIPVLLPGATAANLDEGFKRYWDSEEKAGLYDQKVEGEGREDLFGTYNHQSEMDGLLACCRPERLGVVLDAGCGNGRFLATLPADCLSVGADASLNLLRITRARGRGRFHVCCELENLPFRGESFTTVVSCRVLQHLADQERAVLEMGRVLGNGGDLVLQLYNRWNLKALYKAIRMSPLAPLFNAPFRLLFRSMSPFAPWGLEYDHYTSWLEARRWMHRAGVGALTGRGVGFGYHKYLLRPLYIEAELAKRHPEGLRRYYDRCLAVEGRIGPWPPFRWFMEKFVIRGSKGALEGVVGVPAKVVKTVVHHYRALPLFNREGLAERERQRAGRGVVVRENRFHLEQAVGWLKAAHDAAGGGGVARGYSAGWNHHFGALGWQPAYPETTGYLIPTLLECAEHLDDPDLRRRALAMADWEIGVQMANGAVMGGTVDRSPTPAVFNTGQVILGWLAAHRESGEVRHLEAARRAGEFLLQCQSRDGAWRRGNSRFASPATTYNSRVGWALVLLGGADGNGAFTEAGLRNLEFTLSRQRENGWFVDNCLSDPAAPLLHTICYAVEGLLGGAQVLKRIDLLNAARRSADALMLRVDGEGRIPGRLDRHWNGTVAWDCLTGNAQLANILLTLYWLTGESAYREVGKRMLGFLKGVQNCDPAAPPGLRGGMGGSYPFDGGYGRFQTLNWATKFFVDALVLDQQLGE